MRPVSARTSPGSISTWGEAVDFPTEEQRALAARTLARGIPLGEDAVAVLSAATAGSVARLMTRLLPSAARYACTPLSAFPVGAVLEGVTAAGRALYFGANIEFRGQAPATSIHAEQAAFLNAWLHGATQFPRLAVSSPPCGHCRQFMNEWSGADDIALLVRADDSVARWPLSDLLPVAFGPRDLGKAQSLGQVVAGEPEIVLDGHEDDQLVALALAAARRSYAPYTGNVAGVCLQMPDGQTFLGRTIENAAYNPSLSAMHVALAFMHLNLPLDNSRLISRAVLVERPTNASQRDTATAVLKSWAPDAVFEYHPAGA